MLRYEDRSVTDETYNLDTHLHGAGNTTERSKSAGTNLQISAVVKKQILEGTKSFFICPEEKWRVE